MRSFVILALVALAASPTAFAAPAPQSVSKTSRCGSAFGLTCRGSSFGNCCSRHGYCGSTSSYCGDGCQNGWGSCGSSTPSPTISKNGRCGSANEGATCQGSQHGDCCSQHGWCGQSKDYCGNGCNPLFGTCTGLQPSPVPSPSSQTSAAPGRPSVVSSNARCGNLYDALPAGMTCKGSRFGNCCSKYSYCGSTADYCGTGCQPGFGDCSTGLSSRVSSITQSSSQQSTRTTSSTASSSVSSSAVSSLVTSSSALSSSSASSPASSSAVFSSAAISSSTVTSSTGEGLSTSSSSLILASSSVALESSSVQSTSAVSSTASSATQSSAASSSESSSASSSASSEALTSSSLSSTFTTSDVLSTTSSAASTTVSPTCTSALVNAQVQHDGDCSEICTTITIVTGSCETVSYDSGTSTCTYRLFDGLCPSLSRIPSPAPSTSTAFSSTASSVEQLSVVSTSSSFEVSSTAAQFSTVEPSSTVPVISTEPSPSPTPSASESVSSSEPISSSTAALSAVPTPIPFIRNAGFDNFGPFEAPAPWVASGQIQVRNDMYLWKRSQPNIALFQGRNGGLTQSVDSFDTTKMYRLVFYYANYDAISNGCSMIALADGQNIGNIALQIPTLRDTFIQFTSNAFQPGTSIVSLGLTFRCFTGLSNRVLIDDVSVVEA